MDKLLARRPGEEGRDDIQVSDVGELGALLGEASDIVPEGLILLLPTAPVVP